MPSKCPHCRRTCRGSLNRHISQCLENPRSCNRFKLPFPGEVIFPNNSDHPIQIWDNFSLRDMSFAYSVLPPADVENARQQIARKSTGLHGDNLPREVVVTELHTQSIADASTSDPFDTDFSQNGSLVKNSTRSHLRENDHSNDVIFLPEENDLLACISSRGLKAYTRIFDAFRRCKVPHYGYDVIVSTIFSELMNGNLNTNEIPYSRRAYLRYISERFKTAKPVAIQVRLDNRWNTQSRQGHIRGVDQTHVITFDFKEQLEDILGDQSLFGDLDNLVINRDVDNPGAKWQPYSNTAGTIYEVLDGHWYQQYAKNLILDPQKEFCIPIGLYVDESQTVVYQRYSFQPLVMFPLILNCKARNRVSSSRVLALIPDLDAKSTAIKVATRAGGKVNIGTSMRNYHQCMSAALASLKHYQKNGLSSYVRLGNEVALRDLKIPVAFILGDAKSQDTLSGRFLSRNTKRMCRACNVTFQNSSNPLHKCKFIDSKKYEQRVDICLDLDGRYSKQEKKKHLLHYIVDQFM